MAASKETFAGKQLELQGTEWRMDELYRGLESYSYFLAKNKWDAEDIVQEVFIKVLKSYHASSLSPSLLKKVAYHCWIDTLRKKQHEVVGIENEVPDGQDTGKIIGMLDTVDFLIDRLTPKQAIIFLLKEAFEYQAGEIAALLNTTETGIKSLFHRAKKRLEKQIYPKTADPFWNQGEKEILYDLLYDSLKVQDPAVLIRHLTVFSSLSIPKKPAKSSYHSPLSFYSMAA